MRDDKCNRPVLKGLSFEIADLLLLKRCSEEHGLRMVVHLDHGSDGEEYEEVLAFHIGTSSMYCWMMWRNAKTIVVRSPVGRGRRYGSVAKAIEAMFPRERVVLTDISATEWPCDVTPG